MSISSNFTRYKKYFRPAVRYQIFDWSHRLGLLEALTTAINRWGKSDLQLSLDKFRSQRKLPFTKRLMAVGDGSGAWPYITSVSNKGQVSVLPRQTENASFFNLRPVYKDFINDGFTLTSKTAAKTLVAGHNVHPDGRFVREGTSELANYTMEDVSIFGNLQIFKGRDLIIFDAPHDPLDGSVGHRFIPMPKDTMAQLNMVLCEKPRMKPEKLKDGVILASKASKNYFHFIFEDLSRLMLLEPYLENKELPIYITSDMPLQHYEAILGLFGSSNLIQINRDISYTMDKLYGAQIPMNLSDNIKLSGADRFYACPEHIDYMRTRLLEINAKIEDLDAKTFPKKVYIARKGRSVINNFELLTLLRIHGVKTVDPSKMSFQEQVRMFSQADLVIGAAGAGLSNIIFCRPGAQVIVLNSSRHTDNCVFSTLAHICKLKYDMIVGPPRYKEGGMMDYIVGPMASYMSPFRINVRELNQLLKAS